MFAARQGVWRQHWTQSAAQNINMWPVTEMHSGPLKVWEQENEWWRRWQSFEKLILAELLPKVKHQEFNKFWLQRRRQSFRDKDENLSFIMSAVKHCGWSWLWYKVLSWKAPQLFWIRWGGRELWVFHHPRVARNYIGYCSGFSHLQKSIASSFPLLYLRCAPPASSFSLRALMSSSFLDLLIMIYFHSPDKSRNLVNILPA